MIVEATNKEWKQIYPNEKNEIILTWAEDEITLDVKSYNISWWYEEKTRSRRRTRRWYRSNRLDKKREDDKLIIKWKTPWIRKLIIYDKWNERKEILINVKPKPLKIRWLENKQEISLWKEQTAGYKALSYNESLGVTYARPRRRNDDYVKIWIEKENCIKIQWKQDWTAEVGIYDRWGQRIRVKVKVKKDQIGYVGSCEEEDLYKELSKYLTEVFETKVEVKKDGVSIVDANKLEKIKPKIKELVEKWIETKKPNRERIEKAISRIDAILPRINRPVLKEVIKYLRELLIKKIVWFEKVYWTKKVEKWYVWGYYMKVVGKNRIKEIGLEMWREWDDKKAILILPKWEHYNIWLYPKYKYERIRWYIELENWGKIYTSKEWELIEFEWVTEEWLNVAAVPALAARAIRALVAGVAVAGWVAIYQINSNADYSYNYYGEWTVISLPKPEGVKPIDWEKYDIGRKIDGDLWKPNLPKLPQAPKKDKKEEDGKDIWKDIWDGAGRETARRTAEEMNGKEVEKNSWWNLFLTLLFLWRGDIIAKIRFGKWWQAEYARAWELVRKIEKVDKWNRLWKVKEFLGKIGGKKSKKEIEKSIKSLEKKIEEHEEKIKLLKEWKYQIDTSKIKWDPEKYKEWLLKHWEKEIKTFKREIEKEKKNLNNY